ncbi:MAG: GntR family transcriptional regulator [Rectinemataceae bacterium]|nr:GntR family transcriptional regulator [Rectinemataceae bacterium]
MKTADQPRYRSLRGQVYESLRDRLFAGELKAGQRIDLDVLAESLGVSRTPLREALIILDAEGFVTILPRSGIIINSLSLDDIRNLYETIGALESSVLFAARDSLDGAAIERMGSLNGAMSEALDAGDWEAFYQRNLEFHGVFLSFSCNPVILGAIDRAKRRLYDFPRKKGLLTEWERASIGEHGRILEFLRCGDFRAAAEYIRDIHWSFKVQEHFILRYYELPGQAPEAD